MYSRSGVNKFQQSSLPANFQGTSRYQEETNQLVKKMSNKPISLSRWNLKKRHFWTPEHIGVLVWSWLKYWQDLKDSFQRGRKLLDHYHWISKKPSPSKYIFRGVSNTLSVPTPARNKIVWNRFPNPTMSFRNSGRPLVQSIFPPDSKQERVVAWL